jgi:hypothetical protein
MTDFKYGREIDDGYAVTYCSGPSWLGLFFRFGQGPLAVESLEHLVGRRSPETAQIIKQHLSDLAPRFEKAGIGRVDYDPTSNQRNLIPLAFEKALEWAETRAAKAPATED